MTLIKIGKIVNTHGIKGELRLLSKFPYKDKVFINNMTIYIDKKDEEIILKSIENVGLIDIKDKLISQLSGGQLQRVYLARAFAQDPDIILLDEPTHHLDLKCQIEILDYLNKWTKENNKIIVAVLHDLNLVQAFGEKVVMMNDGKIIGSGNPKDVLTEERLQEVYGIDVKGFMLEVLEKWR